MANAYPEDFDRLWLCFGVTQKYGLGKRGVKAEAYEAWKKVKDRPPVEVMINALRRQANEKLEERRRTRKDPQSFKHACRWLKWRSWEGDEDLEQLPDLEAESTVKRLTDRSWAE